MREVLTLITQGVADDVLVFRSTSGEIKVAKVFKEIDEQYLVHFDDVAAVVTETATADVFICQTHGEKCVYKHHQVVNGRWKHVVWEGDPWIGVINKMRYDHEYKDRTDLIVGITAAVLMNRAKAENIRTEVAIEAAYDALSDIDLWKVREVVEDIEKRIG